MKLTAVNNTSFGQTAYENPVNRKTERNLAVLSSVGGSVAAGAIGAGVTTLFKKGWKVPGIVGGIVAAATLLLTLPAALYKTKVSSFTHEKQMDAFSREKDATSNILEQVNEQIKDEFVPLSEKVKNYSQVQMANNGKGALVTTAGA